MFILSMATAGRRQIPTILLDDFDHIPHLHVSLNGRRLGRQHATYPQQAWSSMIAVTSMKSQETRSIVAIPLSTPRLHLRPVEPRDRDDLHHLEQDPEVMRHLNGGLATPLQPIDPDASPYRMPRGEEHDVWAVIERETDVFLGWVALHVEDEHGELGYRFFRTAWGQGYATEASRAVIADAFERLGLVNVTARTMATNSRSRRVLEKLGMRHITTRVLPSAELVDSRDDSEVEYQLDVSTVRT
jgi:RimJ/RimL family protein N-acetyltransferase